MAISAWVSLEDGDCFLGFKCLLPELVGALGLWTGSWGTFMGLY